MAYLLILGVLFCLAYPFLLVWWIYYQKRKNRN